MYMLSTNTYPDTRVGLPEVDKITIWDRQTVLSEGPGVVAGMSISGVL